jgi:glycerol uptake facilitator-like aquaporin
VKPIVRPPAETCFFEQDPSVALIRRSAVEGIGTLLLMLVICGAGLGGHRLFPDHPSLGLLVNALATPAALVSLILAFGSVSGGHFNPLITGLQWLSGERKLDCTLAYIASQSVGGIAGALLATLMFDDQGHDVASPAGWRLVLSEGAASVGLMIIVFGCARSGRTETGPFAVGAWLAGAIVAIPSTSYANPAVTLGALVATGPVALPLETAVAYVPAEVVGAVLALLVISAAYPRRTGSETGTPGTVPAISN